MTTPSMRLLICAGGTGGGVYPALAVLQALQTLCASSAEDRPSPENRVESALSVLWVGGVGGMEADLVKRAEVPFEAIPAAGLHGVGLRAVPGNLLQLARGYRQARRILRRYQPDVLFFTGGFVAAPLAIAGKVSLHPVPTLLYVPDIEPGLALKWLARFADCVAVTTEEARAYIPRKLPGIRPKVAVTGYPTRPDLLSWSTEAARRALGLADDLPTLLVFGGSKGARSLNRALFSILPELLSEMQVIHVSGTLDWPEVEAERAALAALLERGLLSEAHIKRYHSYPYLHEQMGAALAAADLAVSRAGASCLGEYPIAGLPAILVPYPYAWRYQQVNAQYLARRGAALVIEDKDLAQRMLPEVRGLMSDRQRLAAMGQAMRALAHPEAAGSLAQLLQGLATARSRERL